VLARFECGQHDLAVLVAPPSEDVNPNSDKEVRRALTPVKQLAERLGVAVLIVRHLNKTPGGNHLYRGGGSIGIIGAARVGLLVGPHPDDEDLRVLAGQKSNLGPPPESLKYRIETAEKNSARVKYEGTVEMKPQDLLKGPQDEEERSAADEAREFLQSVLAGGVRKESNSVKAEAKLLSISETTLNRVKRSIGVKSVKIGETWYMSLPDDGGDGDGDGGGDGGGGDVTDTASAGCTQVDDHLDHLDKLHLAQVSEPPNSQSAGKMVIDDNLDNLTPNTPITTTTTIEKSVYLSEDGQDCQDCHGKDDRGRDATPGTQIAVTNEACQSPEEDGQDAPFDNLPYIYVATDAGLAAVVDELRATVTPVAVDTETFDPDGAGRALDVRVARVRLIQIKAAGGTTYLVDAKALGAERVSPLLEELSRRRLLIHNAAYDLAVLRTNYGYIHHGPVSDTMLMAQVFYAGTNKPATLQHLLSSLLEVSISKDEQKSEWGNELSPAQLGYAALDVEHLQELYEVLSARIRKGNLDAVADLENKMVKVIAEMSALGMPVDEELFAECVRESKESAEAQLGVLDGFVAAPLPEKYTKANTRNKNVPEDRNEKVNWRSPDQVLWAFKAAGLPLSSTDKTTLAEVDHPLAVALREYRKAGDVAKRFSAATVEAGRAHAEWRQLKAETGRMACANPPLQTIPKSLRRAFVAPPGHKLVVSDLSQIEIRVLCALSGDEVLRQEFIAGADVHRATAAKILGKDSEEVSPEERKLAKSLVFGLLYGQGLRGFAETAQTVFKKKMTEQEVRERFWEPFFDLYPGVARWRENALRKFDAGMHVAYTPLGRRRLNLTTSRQALNSPIQGGAADVMKAIAVALYERREEVAGLEICGLVHDEVVCTVPEEHAVAAAALVDEVMKTVGEEATNIGVDEDKRVPVEAATQVCDSWAEKE
jgi:DNA polymerase-1